MPVREDAAADSRSGAGGNGFALLLLVLPLIGATFVSKLAVPLVKVDGIGLGFPLIYVSLTLGLLFAGNMRLEPTRLQFFCLMIGVVGGAMVLRGESMSLPSLAFLTLLHLPYVAYLERGARLREAVQRIFLAIATVVALCGLAQYLLQTHVPIAYVFPFENLLPADWRVTGFNMQAPIAYGSSIYRANGVFMQEPSFFSQLLAIAVLVELTGPNRLWRAALYLVAIIASQSGTGLVLLAVCLPILIVAYRRVDLLLGAAVMALALMLAAPYLHLDQLIARIGEFGSEGSSAYERFVGGFHVFQESVGTDPARTLFGYGAGAYREIAHNLGRPAAEMAFFKIVVEYGLIGALLYFGFMFYCILGAQGPLVLRIALVVCLFLNGAYNTFLHSLALALLVWTSQPAVRAAWMGAERRQPIAGPAAGMPGSAW